MNLLHTLFYFVIAIGVLVSIHEFGHFWVARKVGVKVLRFSVGFGPVLWSIRNKPDDTEYVLSAIPLGGYVKMVDEREGDVSPEDLPFAFNRKPVLARAAVVAAGPLFNLLLAVLLFWAVLVIGETGIKPILGAVEQNTLAASAGFVEGDLIVSVAGKDTPTWTEAISAVVAAALDGDQAVAVKVKSLDEQESVKNIALAASDVENPELLYERLGFKPWTPKLKPVIDRILPDSAALAAGLKPGDLIISADDVAIDDWTQWVEMVKSRPDMPIKLAVERDGVALSLVITPRRVENEGKIGAAVRIPEELKNAITVEYSLSPLAAVPVALTTTWNYSVATLKMMGKMLLGKASVKNLSGPVSIAQIAGQSATMGLVPFIKFLGLVSVSLGVLNFLPIPVLDGGHLLFFAIEGIKGSPVPEKIQVFFQQIGIAVLMSLMALAMVLDVQRIF